MLSHAGQTQTQNQTPLPFIGTYFKSFMSTEFEQDFRIGQYTLARVRFGNISLTTIQNNSTPPLCLTPTSPLLTAFPSTAEQHPAQGTHHIATETLPPLVS